MASIIKKPSNLEGFYFKYNWGLTGGPSYACYNVQHSGNDGSLTKTWYDKLAREIRSDVTGFNGSPIYTATEYNTKGQLYRVSEPGASASPSQWNTNTYDNYGRVTGITRPSGRNTTFVYSNNRVTETTGGKTKWKETDSQGLVTTAHDNGGDIVYAYFPDGKVKTITAPGSVVTMLIEISPKLAVGGWNLLIEICRKLAEAGLDLQSEPCLRWICNPK